MLINVTTKDNRHFTIKNEDLVDYDYKCNSTSSNDFELGGAIPRSFDFTVFDHDFKKYQFYGARITVYTNDEAIGANKIGEFIINKTNIQQDVIILESDDDLSNTDITWVGRSFPCTIWEIITSVCNQCNLQLLTIAGELPNAGMIVDNSSNLQKAKCREILKWCAEANGMFCIMDKNNKLVFKKYNFSNVIVLNHDDVDNLQLEQVNTTRKGITIKDKHFGDMCYPYKIDNNPILENLSDANLTIACNRIVNQIKFTDYYAGDFNVWNDDYNPEVGDVVRVTDDDGDTFLVLIHDISMNNEEEYFEIKSYGDSIEDKNTRKNDTDDSGDYSGNSDGSSEGNLQMGRIRNHQRIHAMAGKFTLLEMAVRNTNYFTKVNLELSINFVYTNGKFINFDIYANNKFIRRVPVLGTGQMYHAVEAFVADVDYTPNDCRYSVVVDINDDEELTIEPFDAILSLKATGGTIEDNTATDQLFIEKFEKIPASVLNQNKATPKSMSDRYSIEKSDEPATLEFEWNISRSGSDNLVAKYYSNRELVIEGDTGIESAGSYAWTRLYNQSSTRYFRILNNATKLTINVESTNNYSGMFDANQSVSGYNNKFVNLATVDMSQIENEFEISGDMFRGQDTIRTFTGSPTVINGSAFRNCTGLEDASLDEVETIHTFAFCNCSSLEYADLASCTEIGGGAFANCTSLEYVNLESIERLGAYSTVYSNIFENCTSLATVDNLELANQGLGIAIPINCFKNCTALETINTSTVRAIGDSAFENCSSLEYIDLTGLNFPTDNAQEEMGPYLYPYAFKNCENLKYCRLGAHLPSTNTSQVEPIMKDVFDNCTQMNTVIIYGYYEFINRSGRIDTSCFADTVPDTILLRHLVDKFHPNYSGQQPYFGAFKDCLNRFKTIAMNTNSLPTIYLCNEDINDENVIQEATLYQEVIRVKDLFEEFIGELMVSGYSIATFNAADEISLVNSLVNREVNI